MQKFNDLCMATGLDALYRMSHSLPNPEFL